MQVATPLCSARTLERLRASEESQQHQVRAGSLAWALIGKINTIIVNIAIGNIKATTTIMISRVCSRLAWTTTQGSTPARTRTQCIQDNL